MTLFVMGSYSMEGEKRREASPGGRFSLFDVFGR